MHEKFLPLKHPLELHVASAEGLRKRQGAMDIWCWQNGEVDDGEATWEPVSRTPSYVDGRIENVAIAIRGPERT